MVKTNPPFILPTLLHRSVIFEESLLKIQRDQLQIEQRPPYHYYSLITYPFSVAILAITPEGDYLITEEYRHPTGRILIGCPGGYIDPGEDALKAAQRELLEETGFVANTFEVIGSAYPYVGFSGQKTIYIRALGAVSTAQASPEISEVIRPCLLSQKALTKAIAEGAELDGTLCTALFFHNLKI